MLMITTIRVTAEHRRVIAGRLYSLKPGDVLDVAQYPGDTDADISAYDAAMMLDADMAEPGEEQEIELDALTPVGHGHHLGGP